LTRGGLCSEWGGSLAKGGKKGGQSSVSLEFREKRSKGFAFLHRKKGGKKSHFPVPTTPREGERRGLRVVRFPRMGAVEESRTDGKEKRGKEVSGGSSKESLVNFDRKKKKNQKERIQAYGERHEHQPFGKGEEVHKPHTGQKKEKEEEKESGSGNRFKGGGFSPRKKSPGGAKGGGGGNGR